MGSSSSLSSAGSSSARHLAPGAYSEATLEVPAPGHCCSFADPVTTNLEGAVTFEAPDLPEETLREVRAQLIQKQGDIMGGLGWGGAGDGQSSHDAETADARTVSLSPESRQWMPTSQEAWYK